MKINPIKALICSVVPLLLVQGACSNAFSQADMTSFATGVSSSSVGRFGGKALNNNARINTMLSYMVDPVREKGIALYWPHYAGPSNAPHDVPEYGYYLNPYFFGYFGPIIGGTLEGTYTGVTEAAWEHMYIQKTANFQNYILKTSVLSPGTLMTFPYNKVGMFYNTSLGGLGGVRSVAVPTTSGVQRYTVNGSGNLNLTLGSVHNEGWILVWFNGSSGWTFDHPVLITLQHRIQQLDISPTGMDLTFSANADTIGVLPLYGIERQALSVTTNWVSSGIPAGVLTTARFWNQAMRAFPKVCTEQYKSKTSTNSVDIKLDYTYEVISDDWSTTPIYLAPVPPAVSLADELSYNVTYPTVPTYYMDTLQGPYYAVPNATSVQYTLPAYVTSVVNKAHNIFATPRTANATLIQQIRNSLGGYYNGFLPGWNAATNPSIADLGQQIYPGILSYPFLSGENQIIFKQQAASGLSSVTLSSGSYSTFTDGIQTTKSVPVNTKSYTDFGQEIQDADWYHAYALYSTWAYAYYFNRWDLVSSNWTTLSTKLLPIFKFTSDWSSQCWWANSQGMGLGSEDINMGFGAMAALARMSRQQGATALYNECLYMMAKTAVNNYTSHYNQIYVDPLKPWRNKDNCTDSQTDAPGDGWNEHFGFQFSRINHSQGLWLACIAPYNPSWPEVAWFFGDTGIGIKTQATSVINTLMPATYPTWLTNTGNSMWGNVKILLPIKGYLLEADPATLYSNVNTFYGLAGTTPNYTPWAYVSAFGPNYNNSLADTTPSGPTFYANASYGGTAKTLGAGNYTLAQSGITNDTTSSIRVPTGYTVILWANDNFAGTSWTFTADNANLATPGCDNQLSSVQIFNSTAGSVLYPTAAYVGSAVVLPAGNYTLSRLQTAGITNDTISALKVISGYTVILYDGDNYSGSSWTFTADNSNLSGTGDNATSSLRIIKNSEAATFYPNTSYGGTGVILQCGNYTLSQLTALGITNDTISSLKVPSGRTVKIYDGDNYTGSSWTFTADNANLAGSGDNAMSSVKIE